MTTRRKKFIASALLLVVMLASGLLLLQQSWQSALDGREAVSRVSQASMKASSHSGNAPPLDADETDSRSKPESARNIDLRPKGNATHLNDLQIAEVRQWQLDHGYGSYYVDFGQLSDEELQNLAQAGQIGALHILAERNAVSNPAQAIAYYEEAAIFGSTHALLLIGETLIFHANRGEASEIFSEPKDAALTALAYNFAAQLLYDNAASENQANRILKISLNKSDLTDEALTELCERASNIAQDIRSQRDSRGIIPNSQHPAPHSSSIEEPASVSRSCGM